ncbi:hypothetical protein J2Y02_001205 [Neobacillus drentensis]|nr:hypothetical protein [Neobacillus drentensis]
MNPFTKHILNYTITPGQVANVPQGWWHYEIAVVVNTHLLAIFDAPTPEVILGSDILNLHLPISKLRSEPFKALNNWVEQYGEIWEEKLDSLELYLKELQNKKQ